MFFSEHAQAGEDGTCKESQGALRVVALFVECGGVELRGVIGQAVSGKQFLRRVVRPCGLREGIEQRRDANVVAFFRRSGLLWRSLRAAQRLDAVAEPLRGSVGREKIGRGDLGGPAPAARHGWEEGTWICRVERFEPNSLGGEGGGRRGRAWRGWLLSPRPSYCFCVFGRGPFHGGEGVPESES